MALLSPQDENNMNTPAAEPIAKPEAKTPSFTDWLGSNEAMAFASGLLKAGGFSNTPVSTGQAIGFGMDDMLKAKLAFGNQNLEKDKFSYSKQSDQRDYALRKEDHDVTRDYRRTQIGMLNMRQKRQDALDRMFLGGNPNPTTAPTPESYPNPQGQLENPIIKLSQNAPPGMLNQMEVGTPQQPQAQNGGLLNNLPVEKQNAARFAYFSGHPEKAMEYIYGKPQDPNHILSEGQVLLGADNKPLAYGLPKDTSFTVGEGQSHYNSKGELVVSGNPKNEMTTRQKDVAAEGLKPGTLEYQARMKDMDDKANIQIQHQMQIPKGFQLTKDGTLVRIPGGPAEEVSSQDAGRIQMIRTAVKDIGASRGDVESILFNKKKDGTPDYNSPNMANILNANVPYFQSMPRTEGRLMRTAMEQAIQAITRIETGAAMPQSEIENTMTRYMPIYGDDKKTVLLKWNRFKDFIGDANKLMDPSQHFETDRFKSALSNEKTLNEQMGKSNPVRSNVASMSDAQLKQILGLK